MWIERHQRLQFVITCTQPNMDPLDFLVHVSRHTQLQIHAAPCYRRTGGTIGADL